jgi:hypothetical protein
MMTTGKESRSDQKTTIERLLDDEQVLVHVNAQAPGVQLPPHLAENRTVTLRLSRFFKGDLTTDDKKAVAELLFGSEYFTCILPWSSIWGASSIRGEEFIWAEAAPEEILQLVLAQQQQQQQMKSASSDAPRSGSQMKRQRPSHLKRVK